MKLSQVAAALQSLQGSKDAAVLIQWLVSKHGFTRGTTFDVDPYRTAFNEGRRSVVVDIGTLLDADINHLKEIEDDGSDDVN